MQTTVRSMTFPEAVRFRAERGLSDAVVRAARMSRVSTSEYVRRTVRAQLIADGVPLPPVGSDFKHDRRDFSLAKQTSTDRVVKRCCGTSAVTSETTT